MRRSQLRKLTPDDIKIFDNGTVKECLEQCLSEGYFPLSARDINYLTYSHRVDKSIVLITNKRAGFDTSSVSIANGRIRDATLDELKHIEEFYAKGGEIRTAGIYSFEDGFEVGRAKLNYKFNDSAFVGVSSDTTGTKNIRFQKSAIHSSV
jgi:hypothetical protein